MGSIVWVKAMKLYIMDVDEYKKREAIKKGTPRMKVHHQAGEYLLRQALGDEIFDQVVFTKDAYGKPYIVGKPIYYNISHSGQYAVLVISDSDVGVDVQLKKKAQKRKLAERFFSKREQEMVRTDKEDGERFYRIWCRKEAYGKYLGVGLNEAILLANVFSEIPDVEFHDLDVVPGYGLCICSGKGENLEEIINIFEGL